jgi:hypothetical protein
LGGFWEALLVAFYGQQVIPPGALHDQSGGLQLGVERIQDGDLAIQAPVGQQALRHRNLIGLFVHRLQTQGQTAFEIHRPQEMLAPVADRFAINAQQPSGRQTTSVGLVPVASTHSEHQSQEDQAENGRLLVPQSFRATLIG